MLKLHLFGPLDSFDIWQFISGQADWLATVCAHAQKCCPPPSSENPTNSMHMKRTSANRADEGAALDIVKFEILSSQPFLIGLKNQHDVI